jgi:hypothetical protein
MVAPPIAPAWEVDRVLIRPLGCRKLRLVLHLNPFSYFIRSLRD